MSVIDELVAKLKTAERAVKRAKKDYDTESSYAEEARKNLRRAENRVAELERAISLLRNGLRTNVTQIGGGNVTPLHNK